MRTSLLVALAAAALPCAAQPKDHNPQVESIVRAVSAERIEARIRKLASFHTRHTLSRTDSDTQGIGAARRWIKAELDECSRASGGRLQVELDSYTQVAGPRVPKPVELANVVATLPGKQPRVYVVSGHYDSRASDVMDAESFAPGANDDASGVAVAMELACAMAPHHFEATLVFMAVAGEEQGLLGATHWAEEAKKKGLPIAGMITNDIVGSSTGPRGERNEKKLRLFANGLPFVIRSGGQALAEIARSGGEDDTPTHELGRYLKEVGERYVRGFTVELIPRPDRFLRGGDHLPFLERGYAAVRFTEPVEDYRHQHQDVRLEHGVQYGDLPDYVDFRYVANVARVNAAGLASLALAPSSPREVGIEVVELENDSTLRWAPSRELNLAGYRIVWRRPGTPTWEHSRDVGNTNRFTLTGVSKDDFVFGVVAVDPYGNASPATFPRPWRPGMTATPALKEERTIVKSVLVKAPVSSVWEAWTTKEGIESFFAPEAVVEPRPEGAFRLYINPYAPPGLKGADDMRFLALQKDHVLSFTWNAPPHLPEARMQRTVVIVRMAPAGDGQTALRLTHTGWGEGGEWDKAYDYFERAWSNVLANLQKRFTQGPVDWKPWLESLKSPKK
ncbi:MAG TPA: M28 family peptidase [Burkholderiales bacterium]